MTNLSLPFINNKKNNLPIIKQAQFSECGHACVAMISNYHGHQIDLAALRTIEEPSINGSSMLDLMRLLEHLKLNSRPIRIDLEDLKKIQCPALLHWNMNHFVVLKKINNKHAIIHDPAIGKRTVSLSELSTSFTGILLEVEPAENFSIIQANKKLTIFDVFKQIQGLKNSLLVLMILSLTIELFILINPFFLQYVTDNVVSTNSLSNLYVIATGFIILTLCHSITEYMRSHFVVYLSNRITEYCSSGVMNHLLKVPFSYFERRHKGDILSRFQSMKEIQSKVTTDSINTLLDGIIIVLAIMIMVIYSWQLSALVLISLAAYLCIRIASYKHLKNETETSIMEHAQVSSKFLEIIQSIMPIKLYAKEANVFRDWKNIYINAMNADIKIARANIVFNIANIFLFNIEYILVVTFGAILVITNKFSIGMLIAFLAYRQTLVNKATSFLHKIFEYKLISIQLERVADILSQPAEHDNQYQLTKQDIQGAIQVQNLNYKYASGQQFILNNLNFFINPAEKVVIKGPSGVGKTTLLKIMLGLIAPTDGTVLVDGVDLQLLGSQSYRAICASVMQDDSLISGSILENISFMDTNIDLTQIYKVAKIAQIHEDIIKMPMGYETLIGDMGSSLSGGQKQRIFLARALYKNPKILFLDEASSHLDTETEIKINTALKEMQITQVVIAHREETIKMADRVIELSLVSKSAPNEAEPIIVNDSYCTERGAA